MKKFWNFSKKDKVGELYLYGEIASATWWGDEITPKQFKEDLDALGDIDTLKVYINSGGGDVFAGWNIINILQRHKATKIGYCDGLAASIAFDIYQSMDKRIAMKNSMLMTHNCWTFTMGNRHELRKQADEMEKIDGMLAEMTSKKSGKTVEDVLAIQDAESWYTAQEAVDEGFADELEEGKQLAACVSSEFFALYNHPPEGMETIEPSRCNFLIDASGGLHFNKISDQKTAEQGGILVPVKQGKEPVSDTALDAQKRRFENTNRKNKIMEAKHES